MWSAKAKLSPVLGGSGSFRIFVAGFARVSQPKLRFGKEGRKLCSRLTHACFDL